GLSPPKLAPGGIEPETLRGAYTSRTQANTTRPTPSGLRPGSVLLLRSEIRFSLVLIWVG
ncbi:hypothetical protein A2U01_0100085, partial [Trifolium medium]|nr:hypothetical protein [Trifolium medium]